MAQLLLANPRKRRSTKRRRNPIAKRKANPRRRRTLSAAPRRRRSRRSYRRNPIAGFKTKQLMQTMQDGAIGAAGALGVDLIMKNIPQLSTMVPSQFAPLVRLAVGVGIGVIAAKVGKSAKMKRLGTALSEGAVTVQLHALVRENFGSQMGLGYYDNAAYGMTSLGGYGGGLLGSNSGLLGMGYYNPGQTSIETPGVMSGLGMN